MAIVPRPGTLRPCGKLLGMNCDGWIDVTRPKDLAAVLGIDVSETTKSVYSAITVLPHRDSYWVIREEPAPDQFGDDALGFQVLKTRVFINMTEAKKVRADIYMLGVTYLATQNVPLTTMLGVVRKFAEVLRVLTEDEAEVVRVIVGLAAPSNAYSLGVPETQVRAAYQDATVDINSLLDSLASKGIIRTERIGKVRLIL